MQGKWSTCTYSKHQASSTTRGAISGTAARQEKSSAPRPSMIETITSPGWLEERLAEAVSDGECWFYFLADKTLCRQILTVLRLEHLQGVVKRHRS